MSKDALCRKCNRVGESPQPQQRKKQSWPSEHGSVLDTQNKASTNWGKSQVENVKYSTHQLYSTPSMFSTTRRVLAKYRPPKTVPSPVPPPSPFIQSLVTPGTMSASTQHFVTPEEREVILSSLPEATLESEGRTSFANQRRAKEQKEMMERLMSLSTGNAKAAMLANVELAVNVFGRHEEKGVDTGSPEVQAAVWTVRIRNLEQHLSSNKKDVHNQRQLRRLIHKRAKMLRYLKRQNLPRYYECLKQLELRPEDVEGEIVVK